MKADWKIPGNVRKDFDLTTCKSLKKYVKNLNQKCSNNLIFLKNCCKLFKKNSRP
jgi:hypothetical protein